VGTLFVPTIAAQGTFVGGTLFVPTIAAQGTFVGTNNVPTLRRFLCISV
jgi:hypothetical protein